MLQTNDILSRVKRVHFIGIGGSGMCPIAEILLSKGYELTGSDRSESDTLDRVRGYGIPVFTEHKPEKRGRRGARGVQCGGSQRQPRACGGAGKRHSRH